jgi:two-component system sensor kinase FixL
MKNWNPHKSAMLALFVGSTSDRAFFLVDTYGMIMTWNRGAEILTGWTSVDVIGSSGELLYPVADVAIGKPAADLARASAGVGTQEEAWRLRKDGTEFLADVSTTALRGADGHLHGYGQMIHDITDRKAAQTALERSALHLRSILATVPDPMVVTDKRGTILSFSATAELLFGHTEAQVTGRNASMMMPWPDELGQDTQAASYPDSGEGRVIGKGRVVVGRRRDGTEFPMELWVGEVQSEGHRIFNGFVRDLTEKQRAESRVQELQSELIHVSRLSAMGTMASTLAHELNQPLTAIANYLEAGRALLDRGDTSSEAKAMLREALVESTKEALRAGTIVRRTRDFVSRGDMEKRVEDLPTLIEEASRLSLVGAGERGIQADYAFDPGARDVLVDRVQIQQVLVNLVRNAVEAMEAVPQREILITTSADGTDMVRVSVQDTGPGIDPMLAPNLFGAFATTKDGGMGLGLSICRTIVEAHGGRIWAEPSPSGGTVFNFTLIRGGIDVTHD